MSWIDAHGHRRGDDEDWDSVQADLRRRAERPKLVYCTECHLPMLASSGLKKHDVCPETTSNQDGR